MPTESFKAFSYHLLWYQYQTLTESDVKHRTQQCVRHNTDNCCVAKRLAKVRVNDSRWINPPSWGAHEVISKPPSWAVLKVASTYRELLLVERYVAHRRRTCSYSRHMRMHAVCITEIVMPCSVREWYKTQCRVYSPSCVSVDNRSNFLKVRRSVSTKVAHHFLWFLDLCVVDVCVYSCCCILRQLLH